MANNVQCAGGGSWLLDQLGRVVRPMNEAQERYLAIHTPCGWKGERGRAIPEGWWKHPTDKENYLTRKRCPWCGGKVQLINPTQEVERP